ncbi:MAG: aminopeptidase [Gammaproteobacteria bacterium]
MKRRWVASLAVVTVLGLLAAQGCANLGYYAQSVDGEMDVLARRQPIGELVRDPATPAPLRKRLRLVQRIRNFASRELDLPDNDSYRSYADLNRRYVVWNVFAAPALSLKPRRWCFPLAGCLAYRGYFHRAAAERFAAGLRRRGDDVYVAGIPAYSTLGWFSDPLLSTVIHWPEADLAGLIFHELAHQELYVKGDTAFNESFAMTVEREGVRRWMQGQHSPQAYAAYLQARRRDREFVALVMATRRRLARLYAADLPRAQKLAGKRRIFDRMRTDYRRLRRSWHDYSGYDRWMSPPLNNAKIVSVATYEKYVPAFQELLRRQGGNFKRFYVAARAIAHLPKARRHARLNALLTAVGKKGKG